MHHLPGRRVLPAKARQFTFLVFSIVDVFATDPRIKFSAITC